MKCIVSFSSKGREDYNKAMLGLIRSAKEHWNDNMILYSFDGYCDEYMGQKINLCNSTKFPQPKTWMASPHSEIPYQFKLALVQIAREAGHKQIIWCDSTIRLIKDPTPLFEHTARHGITAFDNLGHPLKHWISDDAKNMMGITDDELEKMPQIMACVTMFDFNNSRCTEIFESWHRLSLAGAFKDGGSSRPFFRAHRHDQAILSALLYRSGIDLLPYGNLVYSPHHITKEYGDDIYFLNKGID